MTRRSRRSIVSTAVVGIILLLLAAACAPAAPAAAPPAADGAPAAGTDDSGADLAGELVLNTWRDIGADPNHPNYAFHLLIQEWAAQHPDVTVTYQPMLGTVPEIFGYISTNLRSGTLADGVVMLYPSPAQMDVDLQYDFAPDLAQPNPYSTNPTWRDDFPLDGIALAGVTTQDKVLMVSNTYVGDLGDGAQLYNQDILDQAGVTELPETWDEFVAALEQIKAAGFDPMYMPSAGNESYIFSWQTGIWSDQLLADVVAACDGQAGENADGRISQIEAVWCLKTGAWSSEDMRPLFELVMEMSPYFHEGYLAPPPPGDLFSQGKVAFRWLSRLNVAIIAADPNITFEWGSYYQPALTEGGQQVRYGQAGAGAGGQYLFIPMTAVDNGKLDLALDLAQYVTNPTANAYWCTLQPVPCFEPGSTIAEIFPDDEAKQQQWRGFVEPGALNARHSGLDINNAFGPANAVEEVKVYQDYLGGTLSLDQALEAWQRLADQLTENAILQHPEWNADQW
jgi:ABC-type glycerol-3-phosphate transport system substrate-binding protein